MTTANDPAEAVRSVGFRASADAIRALIAHATKSKMSPAQTLLELTGLEKRERLDRCGRWLERTLVTYCSGKCDGVGPRRRASGARARPPRTR